jgi:hypothetical protein
VKKYVCFFIGFAVIIAVELFYWEDFAGTPRDLSRNFSNGAIASQTTDGETDSEQPKAGIDPVILLLLGSGLIGLVGLGRKQAPK